MPPPVPPWVASRITVLSVLMLAGTACSTGSPRSAEAFNGHPTASAGSGSSPTAYPGGSAPDSPGVATHGPARPVGGCATSGLALAFASNGSGAGSSFATVTLTNRQPVSCSVQGFPGLSFVAGPDAHQVGAAAVRTTGITPTQVQLAPGRSAQVMVRIGNPNVYPPAQCQPVPVQGFRLYAPGSTSSVVVHLPAVSSACSALRLPGGPQLEIGPVRPS